MRTVLDRETRRQQILTAATTVFARKGYRHASVSDIIEAAGIARGTFYLYFQSKEEIFLALTDLWFEEVMGRLEEYAGRPCSPVADFEKHRCDELRGWLEFFHARRELAQVVFREAETIDARLEERKQQKEQVMQRINHARTRQIRELQEAGYWRADLDVEFVNTCINALFREVVLSYILPREKPDLDWLVSQINTFIQCGVASRTEPGEPSAKQ